MSTAAEPINVAEPNWACPICAKRHGTDLDAARACAALGEPDTTALEPALLWSKGLYRRETGAVRLSRDGDRHIREIVHITRGGKTTSMHFDTDEALDPSIVNVTGFAGDHVSDFDHRHDGTDGVELIGRVFAKHLPTLYTRDDKWWRAFTPAETAAGAYELLGANIEQLVRNIRTLDVNNDLLARSGFQRTSPALAQLWTWTRVHTRTEARTAAALRWMSVNFDAARDELADAYEAWLNGDPEAVVPAVQETNYPATKPGKRRIAAWTAAGWLTGDVAEGGRADDWRAAHWTMRRTIEVDPADIVAFHAAPGLPAAAGEAR